LIIEGLSLITSVSNAVSAIMIAKGLRDSNPTSAALFSTGAQALALLTLLVTGVPEIDWAAVVVFALSGALALGLGRLLYFIAVERIGVSVSSAIIGVNPLMSTFLAVLLLGENVFVTTFAGAALVVAGVYVLSGTERGSLKGGSTAVAFMAAFSYALSNVVRKIGLNMQADAVLAAQVAAVAGTLSFLLYLVVAGKMGEVKVERRSLAFFSGAGFVQSVGWLALMVATEMGRVSVVTTIVFSYPLFILLLSWLFLREEEELTWRVLAGCLFIVVGVIVVSL